MREKLAGGGPATGRVWPGRAPAGGGAASGSTQVSERRGRPGAIAAGVTATLVSEVRDIPRLAGSNTGIISPLLRRARCPGAVPTTGIQGSSTTALLANWSRRGLGNNATWASPLVISPPQGRPGARPAAAVGHRRHGGRHGGGGAQLPRRADLKGGLAYVAIAGLLIYTGSFAIGLGPVFWLLIAEIYPLRIRGAAMSVASMANWAANFVVTVSFLTLLSAIGGVGVFFLFGFLTLVALAYFWRKVPETKGRSLQEIERELVPGRS